jgi:hypothetical protein
LKKKKLSFEFQIRFLNAFKIATKIQNEFYYSFPTFGPTSLAGPPKHISFFSSHRPIGPVGLAEAHGVFPFLELGQAATVAAISRSAATPGPL